MREHRKMTLKRIGIGILCMVFVLSMLAPLVAFAEEKTESGSQVSKRELAYIQISVGDGQETPVFKAGQKVSEFRINVKNNGNVDAHNVRIEPDIKNASDWPFELDKLNYEKELSTIKSGGQTVISQLQSSGQALLSQVQTGGHAALSQVMGKTKEEGEKV